MNESNTDKNPENSPQKRSRWILMLLVAFFVAPLAAALYMNSTWTNWQPKATTNFGSLVRPVLPLPDALPDIGAGQIPPWQLLLPVTGSCEQACAAELEKLLRVRRALGPHADKLAMVLVPSKPEHEPIGGARHWTGGYALLDKALKRRQVPIDGIYLVDPLGNLMMSYTRPVDSSGLRKDLDRLIGKSSFR